MGIDYRFNEWRVSGEKADAWSPMAYRLLSKNVSEYVSGYRIGQILYLHHVKGLTAKEIRQTSAGYGLAINLIKSVIKGFGRLSSSETKEAYEIAKYMVKNEPEVLERMFLVKASKLQ